MEIMSIGTEILKDLWNANLNYKGVRVNGFGIPKIYENENKTYLRHTLSRMKKRGLVNNKSGEWFITKNGKEYFTKKEMLLKKFEPKKKTNLEKNLLIVFDIPEARKNERNWFRWHLKKFKFIMIQKSVWIGPSPFPEDFELYLKKIKLDNCLKRFKLSIPYK